MEKRDKRRDEKFHCRTPDVCFVEQREGMPVGCQVSVLIPVGWEADALATGRTVGPVLVGLSSAGPNTLGKWGNLSDRGAIWDASRFFHHFSQRLLQTRIACTLLGETACRSVSGSRAMAIADAGRPSVCLPSVSVLSRRGR